MPDSIYGEGDEQHERDWTEDEDYYGEEDDDYDDQWHDDEEFDDPICQLCYQVTCGEECNGCGAPLCYLHYSSGGGYCCTESCNRYMRGATGRYWKGLMISWLWHIKSMLSGLLHRKRPDKADDLPF